MTREAALKNFFSSFEIPAYLSSQVPEVTSFPWLVYEGTGGNWGDTINIAVKLWYHSESELEPNAKVREISESIGVGGKVISYDDGKMWLKRGTPWCVNAQDEADKATKVKQLNITIEDWRI